MTSAEYMKRFVHPDDAALVRQAIQRSIETTDPTYSDELAHRALFADGREEYILARWFSVKDARGRTIMTYGVNRDITDLKRYEQRATESEGRFKSLVEQQLAGIVVVRYDGSLAYVNPRFASMLGYETKEVIGQPLLSFIAERDRNTIKDRTRAICGAKRQGAERVRDPQSRRYPDRCAGTVDAGDLAGPPSAHRRRHRL